MLPLIFLLIGLLALAAGAQDSSQSPLFDAQEGTPGVNASYDYVVLGGGTAGVTVAARLAEKHFRVALVEAGDYYETAYPLTMIPAAAIIGAASNPNLKIPIDWGFVIKDTPGANFRDIHYARGKCLGGSSAMNLMIYQRPTVGTMKLWADLVEDESYTFENTLPFFKRTVTFTPPNTLKRPANATAQYNADAFDRWGYPLHVSYTKYVASFPSWMERGLAAIGIEEITDFNSGELLGAQYASCTIRLSDATRSSSESSFLGFSKPAFEIHKKLTIYKNTLGKKVVFDSHKRATGVDVASTEPTASTASTFFLKAEREVIVSGGAFQSPQILMVSGIGPANILKEHGIEVIVDLPGVGQEMWDHVFFGPTYQVALETFTKISTDAKYLLRQIIKYLTLHSGILSNQGVEYLAFEKLPESSRASLSPETIERLSWFPSDWPEIEYLSVPMYVGNFSDPLLQPNGGRNWATIVAALIAPTSRGNITIISADTADLPVISPNWLATETDQDVAIAAYRRVRDMFQSKAMAPIVVGDEYFPGYQYQSDKEILDIIRDTVMTVFHPACTCKMGTRRDSMAVVDSRAKVFGVDGLRVVDASAFPILPPGHPQSVVYMLAEKISSDILSR